MSQGKKLCTIAYITVMCIVIAMIAVMGFTYNGKSQENEAYEGVTSLDGNWVDSQGKLVDTEKLSKLTDGDPERTGSIYYTLPDTINPGDSFSFRTVHIYYKVYVDGELIYEPYVPNGAFYNKSLGIRWNFIKLSPEYAGKILEVRYNIVYSRHTAKLDSSCIGSERGVVLHVIVSRLPSFVVSVILLFLGIFLVVMDIPFSILAQKRHEMLYLGLMSICVASWSLVDIQVIQLFLGNSRLLQVLACYDVMLIPIPAILYIDEAFSLKNHFVVKSICGISFGDFIISTIIHIAGIADLQETLFVSHILIAACAVTMVAVMVRNILHHEEKHISRAYSTLPMVGMLCFVVSSLIEIVRYYRGVGSDSGMFARVGLLIFILSYAMSSIERMVHAVKMGTQAEFISRLAYRDGLTGLGNRTAFQELMTELQNLESKGDRQNVGIIMFDVNDLKAVNDYLGHSVGDRMLLEAANSIKNAFLYVQGQYFRIGGDEFVVMLVGDDVSDRCEKGLKRFDEIVTVFNAQPNKEFHLSVARGCAIYGSDTVGKKLFDVYQDADYLMYQNKKMMKKDRKRGELYVTEKLTHAEASLR